MKMKLYMILTMVLLLALNTYAQQLTHRQGQILVEVKRGTTPENTVEKLKSRFGADVDFQLSQVIAMPMNVWKISFDFAEVNEREVLMMAKNISSIYNAQHNHIIHNRKVPNDPDFPNQWQYINIGNDGGLVDADLDIDGAWEITTGGVTASGDTIVVCVIDDGLDPEHSDFGNNIWINHGEIPDNNIDDDQNGYIDDYRGWDTYNDNDDIYVGGFHGTPVAGIVGAQGDNEEGVTGVNWDVKMMIVRGGGDEASALSSYAYPYIMRQKYNQSNGSEGAFVVSTNASWGVNFGKELDAPLWCNFYDSLGMVGIINCGATINEDVNVDLEGDLPTSCSSDFLISVSNINRSFEKVEFAGFGTTSIDLGAFGNDTYTTQWGDDYGSFTGTSASTPHVTGAAALLYSLPYPELMELTKSDPAGAALFIKNIILNSVKKDAKFNDLFRSSGVLNLKNATELMDNVFSDCPFPFAIDVENIDLDNTLISWDLDEKVMRYDLRYRNIMDTIWIVNEDVTSPFTLSDLDFCSSYEVQIKSFCDMDSSSEYSFSKIFTSLGCCDAPTNLIADSDPETVDENSIFISWNPDQDHESYTVEYSPLNSEGGVVAVLQTTENFVTIPNLRFCEAYEIRVVADCITGEETPYSLTLEAATACGRCSSIPYCDPPPAQNAGEWIESVTLDGQTAVTGENGGYIDNAGFFNLDLRVGTEIELAVEKGFSEGTFDEWVKVWIDINVDGIFSDDEVVFNEGEASDDDVNTVITVQGDVSPGLTKMRVGMVFLDEPTACADSNLFFIFGEYEDYCLNLIGPCDYGLSITSIDPSESEVSIAYTSVDTSIAYNIRYKEVDEGEDAWETISAIDTMAQVTSLEPCTDYVIQVRAVCLIDTSGFAAVSDTFKTRGDACMVNTDDIEFQSVELTPFPNPFSDQLNIRLDSEYIGRATMEVFDLNGQIIHTMPFVLNSGRNTFLVSESQQWSAGIYFIRIRTQDSEYSSKVIKIGR